MRRSSDVADCVVWHHSADPHLRDLWRSSGIARTNNPNETAPIWWIQRHQHQYYGRGAVKAALEGMAHGLIRGVAWGCVLVAALVTFGLWVAANL